MKEKREKYLEQMTANGIHTISVYLPGEVEGIPEQISDNIRTMNYKSGRDDTYLLINCNKNRVSHGTMITQYSVFMEVLEDILYNLGGYHLEDLNVIRADFAFNSRKYGSFAQYGKLHRLLVCCLAVQQGMKNCYNTRGLFDLDDLNFAAKNNYMEAECYDKKKEATDIQPFYNRLELRSKRMEGSDVKGQFLLRWEDSLKTAKDSFDKVLREYNKTLLDKYEIDRRRDKRKRHYTSLTGFLMCHQDVIFCRKQVIDLLFKLNINNPEKRADRFRDDHDIEYYSKTDIDTVAKYLTELLNNYFNS